MKQEDDFLKEGIAKHGFGQWTAILRDLDFQFQDRKTAESLKTMAAWNENGAELRNNLLT